MTTRLPGANGVLPLPLGMAGRYKTLHIHGGPYDEYRPGPNTFGVCVREESTRGLKIDAHLPIHDFAVPADHDQVREVAKQTLRAAMAGKDVWVGCMGGWGRTGLFLSILAKAAGIPYPVDYVRHHYSRRAVETAAQKHFVEQFDVGDLRAFIWREAWINPVLRKLGMCN